MIIDGDGAAEVAAGLDTGNVDEDAISAEPRLRALEQAAGLPLAIIASVTDEDARHWPLRATCAPSPKSSAQLPVELIGPIQGNATAVARRTPFIGRHCSSGATWQRRVLRKFEPAQLSVPAVTRAAGKAHVE
jgi:hypothetical protein